MQVPSAWFGLTDKVIVLFAVPLTCVFIYPWMGRINLGTSQRRISNSSRAFIHLFNPLTFISCCDKCLVCLPVLAPF